MSLSQKNRRRLFDWTFGILFTVLVFYLLSLYNSKNKKIEYPAGQTYQVVVYPPD